MATDDWARVRREARRRREEIVGDAGDADAETAIRLAVERSGLRCRPRPPADALLSGALAVLDPEAGSIWYRADLPADARRLVIAHELAHHWLHDTPDECSCGEDDFEAGEMEGPVAYGPRERREAEANVFAREFLLPLPLLQRWFYDEGLSAAAIAARVGLAERTALLRLGETLIDEPEEREPPPPFTAPLDPSQERAAGASTGPLLVGAGPGTGKTRTLTSRVIYLTRDRGERPESLLALTFSRRAADEMRERIGAVAPEAASRAFIGTFHSYGLDLLRRYWEPAGLPPHPLLLEPADGFGLLERHLARCELDTLRYLHDPGFPLPDILAAIGRAKEEMLDPDEYARRVEASGDERLVEVARAYRLYEELLKERGAIDFADLVMRPVRLLEARPDILAAERARRRRLLVDEYQDVNRAGAYLVRLLAGDDGSGLWAVGDLRQAIYAFRGASPANVSAFEKDYPNGERAELAVNYRSRPSLVELFGQVCGEGAATWQAARAGEGTATLAVADDDSAQYDGIASAMRAFAADGYALADQAVLCRTRGQASAMRAALAARGIAVAPGPEEGGFFARPETKDLLSLLSLAAEPRGPAAYRIPALPPGLPAVGNPWDFLAQALFGAPGWARRLGDRAAAGRLLALARGFQDRARLLEEDEEPGREFLRYVRRAARLGVGGGDPPAAPEDAVRVLTVHSAKGLEFPVVFVPNLSKGKFPPQAPPSLLPPGPIEEQEEDEEARLFFVALTRARDHLVLCRAEKYNNRAAQPSPLLAALEGTALRRVEWRRNPAVDSPATAAAPAAEPETPPVHLEAWEAELYTRCPRRYFYERVAHLNAGDESPYNGFRRAVRGALRRKAEGTDPADALSESWQADGPPADHPHEPIYRRAAQEIVRAPHAAPSATPTPPPLTLDLPSGTVSVRADAAPDPESVEYHTFRKTPKEGKPDPDARLTLLRQAARQQAGKDVAVHIRYLRTGEIIEAPDRPRLREKHLSFYDDALRGVARGEYPATPDDEKQCPGCPFFFICPA